MFLPILIDGANRTAFTHSCPDIRLYLHVTLPLNACGLHAIPPALCRRNFECPQSCNRIPPGNRQPIRIEIDSDAEQPFHLVDKVGQRLEAGSVHVIVDIYICRAERKFWLRAAKELIDVVLHGCCCAQDRLRP